MRERNPRENRKRRKRFRGRKRLKRRWRKIGTRCTHGESVSGEGRDATSAATRVPGANADDSSFLASVGYFRPATIFEGDSSRGFAAVLVRVCARWPAQHRRPPHRRRKTRRQGSRFAGSWGTRVRQNHSCSSFVSVPRKFHRESLCGGRSRSSKQEERSQDPGNDLDVDHPDLNEEKYFVHTSGT